MLNSLWSDGGSSSNHILLAHSYASMVVISWLKWLTFSVINELIISNWLVEILISVINSRAARALFRHWTWAYTSYNLSASTLYYCFLSAVSWAISLFLSVFSFSSLSLVCLLVFSKNSALDSLMVQGLLNPWCWPQSFLRCLASTTPSYLQPQ